MPYQVMATPCDADQAMATPSHTKTKRQQHQAMPRQSDGNTKCRQHQVMAWQYQAAASLLQQQQQQQHQAAKRCRFDCISIMMSWQQLASCSK